jgi:hypothetical protein
MLHLPHLSYVSVSSIINIKINGKAPSLWDGSGGTRQFSAAELKATCVPDVLYALLISVRCSASPALLQPNIPLAKTFQFKTSFQNTVNVEIHTVKASAAGSYASYMQSKKYGLSPLIVEITRIVLAPTANRMLPYNVFSTSQAQTFILWEEPKLRLQQNLSKTIRMQN